MDVALSLGAEKVATGHYAQLSSVEKDGETIYRLLAGNDNNKDQSYFLCQLSQDQLSKALFPIGHLTKPQVREIAKEIGLVTADKKDSQGLCFIGKVSLPEFLKQQLQPKEGEIVEIFRDFRDLISLNLNSHQNRKNWNTFLQKSGIRKVMEKSLVNIRVLNITQLAKVKALV